MPEVIVIFTQEELDFLGIKNPETPEAGEAIKKKLELEENNEKENDNNNS